MNIADRNTLERADMSEFYGSAVNPNEGHARRILLWMAPLAGAMLLLLLAAAISGAIKASSLLVVLVLFVAIFSSSRS